MRFLAYIDPGTGSMIWQGLVAALLAVGVTIKVFWRRIAAFFSRKPKDTQAPAANGPATNGPQATTGPAPTTGPSMAPAAPSEPTPARED
jgi:hypothetical protein